MGKAKNDNIKGQGFHTHPDRINKKGRPPAIPELTELLAEFISEPTPDNKTKALKLIEKLYELGTKQDNVRAIELLLERIWGKVTQKTELDATVEVKTITGMVIN